MGTDREKNSLRIVSECGKENGTCNICTQLVEDPGRGCLPLMEQTVYEDLDDESPMSQDWEHSINYST